MDEQQYQFKDDSGDKKYFAIVPYIIINGYDATTSGVYAYIKRRCGESNDGKFKEAQKNTCKKLKLSEKTYRKILQRLEEEKRIKFIGWIKGKTHPIKMFEIMDIWKENILAYYKERKGENRPLSPKEAKERGKIDPLERGKIDRQKKKPIEEDTMSQDCDTLFSLEEKLKSMEKNKQRHINIIALYWRFKKIQPTNKEQYQSLLKRDLRGARDLVGFSNERIFEVMKWLRDENTFKFSLETIPKYITENLKQINPIVQK